MSDDVIRRGDMVRVVYVCCHHSTVLNLVFVAEEIQTWNYMSCCHDCDSPPMPPGQRFARYKRDTDGRAIFIPVAWLKKIKPSDIADKQITEKDPAHA